MVELIMNNTDKLLRAFIEASGFSIEENTSKCSSLESNDRDFFGNYIKVDYKVTKKRVGVYGEAIELLESVIQADNDGEYHHMQMNIDSIRYFLNERTKP